jgi:hypothetical protein
MAKSELANVSRASIFKSEEFAPLKENLIHANEMKGGNWNPLKPIRAVPFQAFFAKDKGSFKETKINKDLPRIFKEEFGIRMGEYAQGSSYSEAISIPASLVALKIADMVVEGAEPYSQWKEYIRVVDMPTPLFNVPIDKYTDWVGSDDFEIFRATDGGPIDMGGETKTVALNTEDNNGYYRAKVGIRRNDIRDNKFLAVEQNLKNAGAAWYFALGKKIIDFYIANATNTDTLANLDLTVGSVHAELEGLVNVIRNQFPGTQLNRADTAFFHPADAYQTVVKSTGASGIYPFLDNRMLAPNDEDVINNSGMAKALGLKRAFETPQSTENTVVIIKRDIAAILGLHQDLEIENFDMTVSGLTESALSMRLDIQQAHPEGLYTITAF